MYAVLGSNIRYILRLWLILIVAIVIIVHPDVFCLTWYVMDPALQ